MGQFNNKRHDFFCLMMNLLSIIKKNKTQSKHIILDMHWNRPLCRCGQTNTQAESRFRQYVKRVDTTVTAHVSYAWRGCVCVFCDECVFCDVYICDVEMSVCLWKVWYLLHVCVWTVLWGFYCVCVLDLDGYWQHAESWHTAVLSSTHSPVWPFKCILTLCWRCPMRLRMTAYTQIQT